MNPGMPNMTLAEVNRTRRALVIAAIAISVALLVVAGLFYNSRLTRVEHATVDSPCLTAPHSMACHQIVHHQIQSLTAGEACLIVRRAARPDSQSTLYRECLTHRHRVAAAAAKTPGTPERHPPTAPGPATSSPSSPSSSPPPPAAPAPSATTAPPAPGRPSDSDDGGPPPAPTPSPPPNPQPSPQPTPQPPPNPGGGAGLPLPGPACHLAPRLC